MSISDFFKINQFKQQIQELENTLASINLQLENTENELSLANQKVGLLSYDLRERNKFIKSHLPVFEFSRFELPASYEQLKNLWSDTWSLHTHNLESQVQRQRKACASQYTPLDLSPNEACGHFRGLETDYCTTLVKCECMDFQRRALPCKHMYRLAHEFDVFMLNDVRHNPNVSRLVHLNEFRHQLKTLAPESYEILSKMKHTQTAVVKRCYAMPLINSGFAIISKDKSILLDSFKRDELYNLLPENTTIRKNARKMVIIEYILANHPDVVTNIEKLTVSIELSPNIERFQSYI